MQPTSDTKLVMIDFGNVLYEIDFTLTTTAFTQLAGYNGAEILFGVEDQDPLFMAADRGDVSVEEFRKGLRERYGFTASDAEIDAAWCAILIAPFPHALDVMRDLRLQYPQARHVLISNISALHHAQVQSDRVLQQPGGVSLQPGDVFDALYLSYLMRLRKPDPEAFLHVCRSEGIAPTACVLFDDSTSNCASARELGIRAVHVTPGDPRLAFREPQGA